MELIYGHRDDLPHAAIDMDSEYLQPGAAIGPAGPAGDALVAVEIGFDGAEITGTQARCIFPDLKDLNTELMAENAGIFKEGLAAPVGMQVGTADPDLVNPDQGFALTGPGRGFGFCYQQLSGFLEYNGLHARILPARGRSDQPVSPWLVRAGDLQMAPVG